MQILLACAKNMTTRPELSPSILTKPKFLEEAERHALQLAAFTEAELGKALKCNPRLAILRQQPSVDLLLFIWPAPAYGPDQKLPFRG